ncbi:D-alanyl-D-alanine carboxypeptidase [Nannocystis exedens]|uniref:D-alanyl-D-alanine carboxypeptidase n=1 Tax=Nannocystis exedens TaxID=54 RepID=A0A1I1XFB5_9BACT|nr:M15 family metallopeptidase [Nannocystis exedens]PCC73454.1 penicillin-resistant DD-carboxypeptidase [Nannocystis exedens]SFE06057.1 D-alanyl-D-alanine carboxypeptidase [Nannocystis exedens]
MRRWEATHPRPAVGYVDGKPIALQVVELDGKPVEVTTAAALGRMREAAARDGVQLENVGGFRTMEEQSRLRECYVTCSCNNCNYAEAPGHSQHQSGRALDLNARAPGVFAWLSAHAAEHGFYNTVPGEPWHWEFWATGAGQIV